MQPIKDCCRFVFYLITLTVLMSIVEEVSRKIARARRRKPNCVTITSFPWSVLLSNIALDHTERENRLVIVKFKIVPETELGFCRIALCRAEKKIEVLLPSWQVNFIFCMPHLNITCARGTQWLITYCFNSLSLRSFSLSQIV